MKKSVLISIQPKWCRLIADGHKTIEVRKSRPKLKTPFKVYIYCTKGGDDYCIEIYHGKPVFIKTSADGLFCGRGYANGKIVGEFVCDKIEMCAEAENNRIINENLLCKYSCMDKRTLYKYLHGKAPYAWRISDLVIYDEPKELSEFGKSKPPQSWCYVEED